MNTSRKTRVVAALASFCTTVVLFAAVLSLADDAPTRSAQMAQHSGVQVG